MIKQEFFYHEQLSGFGRSLGWSIRLVPTHGTDETNHLGERMVWLTSTRCNKKDKFFNKKIARQVLRERTPILVRCKDVPAIMRQLNDVCEYGSVGNSKYIEHGMEYNHILKKFL